MSYFLNFPNEILLEVAVQLRRISLGDLYRLLFTCRRFYHVASEILYSEGLNLDFNLLDLAKILYSLSTARDLHVRKIKAMRWRIGSSGIVRSGSDTMVSLEEALNLNVPSTKIFKDVLGRMGNLTTFSLCANPIHLQDYVMTRNFVARTIHMLPESLRHLDIDTIGCGDEDRLMLAPAPHLCLVIQRIAPRLITLRLRVGKLCYQAFKLSEPSTLRSIVLRGDVKPRNYLNDGIGWAKICGWGLNFTFRLNPENLNGLATSGQFPKLRHFKYIHYFVPRPIDIHLGNPVRLRNIDLAPISHMAWLVLDVIRKTTTVYPTMFLGTPTWLPALPNSQEQFIVRDETTDWVGSREQIGRAVEGSCMWKENEFGMRCPPQLPETVQIPDLLQAKELHYAHGVQQNPGLQFDWTWNSVLERESCVGTRIIKSEVHDTFQMLSGAQEQLPTGWTYILDDEGSTRVRGPNGMN